MFVSEKFIRTIVKSYSSFFNKKRLLLIAGVFFSASTYATDSLRVSLDYVLQKALLNSKLIEQASLNSKEQESLISDKKSNLLPSISLRGSASYATNMPIYDNGIFNKPSQHDVIHYLYDTGADFYLNLYNGGRDVMEIQSQKLKSSIANIDWLETTAKVKMDVCNIFLDLKLCYKNKELIQNDIEDQREQLKEIQNLYKAGTVLHSDVLRIELELSKREMLAIKIDNDIIAYNQKLQFITGLKEIMIPSGEESNNKALARFEDILNITKHNAFTLRKSEQHVELKKLGLKQAKSNYLPTLSLTGNYTFANPQIFLYPYNDSWYTLGIIGLKASYPISSLYTNKHKVSASKIALSKEEVLHHHEEDVIENQLLQAYLDFNLAKEQESVCLKNVDLATENARIIKNRYFQSAALVTDLLDADMQHLQTLFELESAHTAIQKHYYFIEFLKGTI